MFDRFKRKTKELIKQNVRKSSNEGLIHTAAVVTEALLFAATIFFGGRYSRKNQPSMHIDNVNVYFNMNNKEEDDDNEEI